MSELKPRLMISKHPLADDVVPWPADYRPASVGEVVVWLREQGAGEEVEAYGGTLLVRDLPERRFLLIPLDTEPPKESE